jgi:hypothetical protein
MTLRREHRVLRSTQATRDLRFTRENAVEAVFGRMGLQRCRRLSSGSLSDEPIIRNVRPEKQRLTGMDAQVSPLVLHHAGL